MRKKIKHYISAIDIMLREHKLLKPNTKSEQEEIDKHLKIANARDKSTEDAKN